MEVTTTSQGGGGILTAAGGTVRATNKEGGGKAEAGASSAGTTMSSITMRSEFDLLGSTNLDGCKILSVLLITALVCVSLESCWFKPSLVAGHS